MSGDGGKSKYDMCCYKADGRRRGNEVEQLSRE